MNISIIGTGNVANVLARLAIKNGHTINQIAGRNEKNGRELALLVNATYCEIQNISSDNIDACIIAISDEALTYEMVYINLGNVLVLHTGGSVSMNVLKSISTNFGVLYPLQSLRKEMQIIPPMPILIEANNGDAFNKLESFANTLSDDVRYVEEDKRLKLHTGAVIVSNFSNYLYALTETFCKAEGLDFDLLKPLIKETAIRIENVSPIDVQTGPAIRKDVTTLGKHLKVLSPHTRLKIWYTRFSDGIMNGEI
jgi:predicted short-subunit dehydrogenase-like oxidoreductase (DUF2520 family)